MRDFFFAFVQLGGLPFANVHILWVDGLFVWKGLLVGT